MTLRQKTVRSGVSRETPLGLTTLFSNAEIAENHIQNVVNLDPPGESSEPARRQPKLLRNDVLASTGPLGYRPTKRLHGLPHCGTVPLTRYQGRLALVEERFGVAGQRG